MLTSTTTLDQSEPGSNGNEGVLHTYQSSQTRSSPSDAGHSFLEESHPSAEDTVSIFYASLTWVKYIVRLKESLILQAQDVITLYVRKMYMAS